jgi:hypothetical protein
VIPRPRSAKRIARLEKALSPRTPPGRVRGRPGPRRLMLIRSMTAVKASESWRCPTVTLEIGCALRSAASTILLVKRRGNGRSPPGPAASGVSCHSTEPPCPARVAPRSPGRCRRLGGDVPRRHVDGPGPLHRPSTATVQSGPRRRRRSNLTARMSRTMTAATVFSRRARVPVGQSPFGAITVMTAESSAAARPCARPIR